MQSHLFTKSRPVAGILVVAVVVGCGGTAASGAAGTPAPAGSVGAAGATATAAPARTRRGSANLITSEEIIAGNYRDAFDIVERLRPQLLLGRGAGNPTEGTG